MDDPEKCDLITPFELYGRWWRAGSDQLKSVTGCLSYTPVYGLQLQLYDDLPDEGSPWSKSKEPDQPIWGEVSGFAGKIVNVSLFDEIFTNRPNDPAIKEKTPHPYYFVNHAIFGVHAKTQSSLQLASIHFSISDLESFLNTKPITAWFDGETVKVDYTVGVEQDLLLLDNEMKATTKTLIGTTSLLEDRRCIIRYRDNMSLVPTTPMPFEQAQETVFTLVNFFLMCARESVELRYLRGTLNTGEIISSFGSTRRPKRSPRIMDWVLSSRELNLEDAINKWLLLVKKIGFIGPVFFSELAAPSPVQDARFFHFAGCLEAFHREVMQADAGKFLSRSEFKGITISLLGHLPATLSENLKDALRAALNHANDHSFAERIDALFNNLEPTTRQALTDDPPRFLAAIKHSRNKLAHVSDEASGETFEGVEYAHASLSLRAWLTILMLKECGIAESLIRERMIAIGYFHWGPFKFANRDNLV